MFNFMILVTKKEEEFDPQEKKKKKNPHGVLFFSQNPLLGFQIGRGD